MAIYQKLIERVSNGDTFHINFEKRTMKVGKEYLIEPDKEYTSEDLFGKLYDKPYSLQVVLHMIRELYRNYKHSLPSERSDSKRKKYFKALSVDELTDEQLICSQKREITCASLEGFILCSIIAGHLYWDEEVMEGKWFWESRSDPDLILLRGWIDGRKTTK